MKEEEFKERIEKFEEVAKTFEEKVRPKLFNHQKYPTTYS